MVTEDRKRLGLFAEMSVGENITICTLRDALAAGMISGSREHAMAESTVKRLGVRTSGVDARITSLSGGNQQKCIIGRWLLTKPKVLLLDDPTRGIDVGAKAELYRLMDQLCREGLGVTPARGIGSAKNIHYSAGTTREHNQGVNCLEETQDRRRHLRGNSRNCGGGSGDRSRRRPIHYHRGKQLRQEDAVHHRRVRNEG